MIWFIIYNGLFGLFRPLLYMLSFFNPRLGKAHLLRSDNLTRARIIRDLAGQRPIWIFHGASVGELMQVSILAYSFQTKFGNSSPPGSMGMPFFLFTYFSPSAERVSQDLCKNDQANFSFSALPWDDFFSVSNWLKTLQPSLLVSASYDIWPNLVWALTKKKCPIFLISALLSEKSGRFRGLTASLYKNVYSKLRAIDAVDQATAQRYRKILKKKVPIFASGDTRCDYIQDIQSKKGIQDPGKKMLFEHLKKLITQSKKRIPVFIVASVYQESDDILLPVIASCQKKGGNILVLYVPHHTDEPRIRDIEAKCAKFSIALEKITALSPKKKYPDNGPGFILINTTGLLFSLYSLADFAFIGGSFHKKIHNTLEPSYHGLPMAFGPHYKNAPEAIRFVEGKGARVVHNSAELASWLEEMRHKTSLAKKTGQLNFKEFQKQLGSTEKARENILSLLKR
jgi:3-deoxy-D-manno-octulosonic-acid transferase